MVLGLCVFPVDEDVDIAVLLDVVDRNCLILKNNWKRLIEFSNRETGKKVREVVAYASANWLADLDSIRERLAISAKTQESHSILSVEFEQAYNEFVRLLFFGDFANFVVSEECEKL